MRLTEGFLQICTVWNVVKGMKNVIPGVSRGETANNRVLVAREFTGTRAPNTRESKSATRTPHEYSYKEREFVLAINSTRGISRRGRYNSTAGPDRT